MTHDANSFARANGRSGLRAAMDQRPCPEGWSFIGDHRIEAPRMLVKGLLPYEGIAFIGGQSGAGKTFLACDLAVALASETAFFGHQVKERVGVAFLAAEGREHLGNRLRAAAHARGIEIDHLPIAWRGDTPLLKTAKDVKAAGEQLAELAEHVRSAFGVRLGAAILDTVAATFDMEDEDKNSEVAKAIRNMRELGAKLRGLVIPIHHYGKTAATGLRGASAWRAGADVVLSVIAERKEQTGEISGREFALAKARDGIEGPIAPFDLTFAELGTDEDGDPFGTCIVEARLGEPSRTARPARESVSFRTFRASFSEAIDTGGSDIRIRSDGPMVRAVPVANVQAEFFMRYPTGESDAKAAKEARRKAFKRTLDKMSGQFPTLLQGETEWIWSATKMGDADR